MKGIAILLIVLLFQLNLMGQQLNESAFDFWIGEWSVYWKDQNGKIVTGSNEIERTTNKKVIQENFHDPNTNFKGTSLSVYSPTKKTWHQAWADSNGSYFDFIGDTVNGNPSFKTKTVVKDGEKIIQRMVFKEITKNSFVWVWEETKDGGEHWNELWKINYIRI